MNKTFKIDNFNISIDDDLYNKAVECYVIEKGDTDEEKYGNYLYFKNLIRASSCKDLEDLKKFSYKDLRTSCSDEEISRRVCALLKEEIADYGGTI